MLKINNITNQQIQHNFNKVATKYLSNTNIQRVTALAIEKTIYQLDFPLNANDLILDLGSGPGTLLHTNMQNSSILYDISLSMLKESIQQNLLVAGDASYLPFADNSFNYIVSNLMLQWVQNKNKVFTEISRILKPNGKLIMTMLTKPSLWQIEKVWQHIDSSPHILKFEDSSIFSELFSASNLQITRQVNAEYKMYFNSYLEIMQHFKATGTSIPKPNNTGLYGRQIIQKVEDLYISKFGEAAGLPLSYCYTILAATNLN
jgi:malonyl-CoA O-methyltransferase